MSHKIGVRHIDVHGAGAGALAALFALRRVAPDAQDAQHAEQAHARAACAEIVAERSVEEQPDNQEQDDETRGRRQEAAVHQSREIVRPFQQLESDAHGQLQVEGIAQQLQVALCPRGHAQARQVQQPPEPGHPVLCRAEGTHPAAEEHTRQQHRGQQPLAHVLRARGETENQSGHEN